MDAQELRSLQEAYMEVVMNNNELSEMSYKKLPVGKMMWKAVNRTEREANARADREREANEPNSTITYDRAREEHEKAEKNKERNYKMVRVADTHSERKARKKSKLKNEEADLYDIILSHLLDEGYAETQEQAQVIMVNMSEDWRESILSEAILEYQPFKDKRKRVKSKVKKLESQKSEDPKDLGFRNARLQKRIDSMKAVLGKKNKEITSASQQKSYDSMAKGGFKHHDDPQSKYYIK